MKILILSFYYPPDLCAGSFRASATVSALLKYLPDNAQIEVITTLPNRYQSFNCEALEHEITDRLAIHRIRLPIHKSGMVDQTKAFFIFMKQALQLTKNKEYQLIYGTSGRLMTAALSAYLAKKNKTTLYLDIRDIFADTIKDVLPKRTAILVKPFCNLIEKWSIKQAQHINLVSEGFRDYFTNRYPKQSFSYFTNGIDEDFLNSSKVKVSILKKSTKKIILYAGNIGEGQGLHRIIPELAQEVDNRTQFLIIGDGGRKVQLQKILSELNIKNVELLPPVNRTELIKKYQQADILFLHLNNYPAFDKVLPSKIFEYAAIGKPILAGVSGYSATFIETEVSNAAVFEPCNTQQAIQAINRLQLVNTHRDEFVKKFIRTNIMDNMARHILSIYNKNISK